MSMRPLDLQVMVPKMTEIARNQNNDGARQLAAAQRGAENAKNMVDADVHEVHAKKDAQQTSLKVRREREGDGRKGGNGGNGGNGGAKNGEGARRGDRGRGDRNNGGNKSDESHIDIKL